MDLQSCPAWHNGNYTTVRDLSVGLLDLGLIHSDATYDVLSIHQGRALMLDSHINRFVNSCLGWRLPLGYSKQEIADVITQLYKSSGLENALCWIAVTRGVPASGNPRDLVNCKPNVIVYIKPYFGFNHLNAARLCIASNPRVPDWALNQSFKNWAWQDLTQAQWQAIDRGYDSALLFTINGYLTEGPGFNVGIIKDNKILAPACNRLPGITMELISSICVDEHIDFDFVDIDINLVNAADDMFITSTAGNIVPVIQLENRTFEQSTIQQRLQSALSKALTVDKYSTKL